LGKLEIFHGFFYSLIPEIEEFDNILGKLEIFHGFFYSLIPEIEEFDNIMMQSNPSANITLIFKNLFNYLYGNTLRTVLYYIQNTFVLYTTQKIIPRPQQLKTERSEFASTVHNVSTPYNPAAILAIVARIETRIDIQSNFITLPRKRWAEQMINLLLMNNFHPSCKPRQLTVVLLSFCCRQRIGKMLVEVFRTAANNGTKLNVNEVMQLVQQIVEDPDMQIRLDLIEHIPHVATISCGTPHEEVIYDYVTSIIIRYLKDQDNQIRMTAQTAVLLLTKRGFFDNTTIETKFCPVIESLCTSADFSGISVYPETTYTCACARYFVHICAYICYLQFSLSLISLFLHRITFVLPSKMQKNS
ncbi:hypothetical protein E2986_13584, partial [Frieseomelitta varia]